MKSIVNSYRTDQANKLALNVMAGMVEVIGRAEDQHVKLKGVQLSSEMYDILTLSSVNVRALLNVPLLGRHERHSKDELVGVVEDQWALKKSEIVVRVKMPRRMPGKRGRPAKLPDLQAFAAA
jgi:hypothetical protein